ncbi:MAG TPA: hypothetical protein VEO02_13810, partial [Thermoanaerobaculia bacterium]|nr:hypothetical protein [Thermoanaerobaculia bacterium]
MALERLGDQCRPLRPPARVLLQALENNVLKLLPDLGPERPKRLGNLMDDAIEDRLHFSRERRFPGETL